MHRHSRSTQLSLSALLLAAAGSACGSSGPSGDLPSPSVACANEPVVQLAAGEHQVVNPAAQDGCLRVPAAGAGGASYLVVLASAAPNETAAGVFGPYLLRGSRPDATTAPPATPRIVREPAQAAGRPRPRRDAQRELDYTLRGTERRLAADPLNRMAAAAAPVSPAPPPTNDVFKVCTNLTCTAFTDVAATRRYLGTHTAIYLDDDLGPGETLLDADFTNLGATFDNRHYPIATTAFGAESDIDGNGVVIILITDQVNALTPDCTNGRVVGYFFGGDLLNIQNSNQAEIFYTLATQAATTGCPNPVTRSRLVTNLKPALIHEMQHMISFNQHALLRGGGAEQTWLNEALSHFAEELADRQIPDVECVDVLQNIDNCAELYSAGNILNAWDYMRVPQDNFLVIPGDGGGTLEERGTGWLFLRWVLDQFTTDAQHLGQPLVRNLVETNLVGVNNIVSKTGGVFADMVPRYLMTLYLDDRPGFTDPTGLLQFESWGLRAIFIDPANASTFPGGFPLVPLATNGTFTQNGTLRAGSGTFILLQQPASGEAIDLQVLRNTAGDPLDQALVARYGIVRIQ